MRKAITGILLTFIAICTIASVPALANADTQFQTLGIRMRGVINTWGNNTAFGWTNADVKLVNNNGTLHQWAEVQALWSLDKPRLNCTQPPTQNVTFVVYAARMTNVTTIELNSTDYNLLISGTWNVFSLTTSIYVDEFGHLLSVTKTLQPILTGASGELRVTQTWMKFNLAITGIDTLSGLILMHRIAFVEIKLADLNDDGKVDLLDLIRIAKVYRMVPGMPGYAIEKDFNFNQQIDLGDLTTVAASIDV